MSDRLGIDVFWSFRSPWSYLATPRLAEWAKRYALDVRFRPVYPIAIRTPEFFATVHPQWFGYLMTDVFRVAEFLELPFVWPSPDPVVSEMNSEGRPSFPDEQPYIHRLTRLGVLAEDRGQGIAFANAGSGLPIFGQLSSSSRISSESVSTSAGSSSCVPMVTAAVPAPGTPESPEGSPPSVAPGSSCPVAAASPAED